MLEAKGVFRISFSKERMTLLFMPKIVLETRLPYKGSCADRRVFQGFNAVRAKEYQIGTKKRFTGKLAKMFRNLIRAETGFY